MNAEKKVLVIDDNPSNLKLMSVLLTLENYSIKTAMNANEALEILETFEPILIIMDLQLPGMDGLELTRILKKNPKYLATPIVAVTAYAMEGDKKKSLDAGCDGYISKPINPQTFPIIIDSLIKKIY